MLKTYLYVPEQLNDQINYIAKLQNKSKAAVIRLALENGLQKFKVQGNAGVEVLFKLTALGKKHKLKGPKDSSTKIDEYLWGKDWSKSE